jgi:hypothetical protein
MLPPTQLSDRRTYGPENLRSAMQKDFFDSIDPELPSSTAVFCDALFTPQAVALPSIKSASNN